MSPTRIRAIGLVGSMAAVLMLTGPSLAAPSAEHGYSAKPCGLIAGGIAVDARGVKCSVARNIAGRARSRISMANWRCRWTSPRGMFGRCDGRGALQGNVVEWYVAD